MIGKTLNHFKVLDRLGKGGMGEVYVAEDGKFEAQTARDVYNELRDLNTSSGSSTRPASSYGKQETFIKPKG